MTEATKQISIRAPVRLLSKIKRWADINKRTVTGQIVFMLMAQDAAYDAKMAKCLHCGTWFEAGKKTGRRLDAKFCSDDHRIAFNSLKRSQ